MTRWFALVAFAIAALAGYLFWSWLGRPQAVPDAPTGKVACKYLALDQSMLFLALVNYLTDGAVQRRFGADPIMLRALPIIREERFF